MVYVIVDQKTWRYKTQYTDERAAKSAFTRQKLDPRYFEILSWDDYVAGDRVIQVVSLATGKTVNIYRSAAGTCCDPSTERYWAM